MICWEAVSAIGTFIAVSVALFVALFGQWATNKMFGPRVHIEFKHDPPFLVRTERTLVSGDPSSSQLQNLGPAFWIRIRIHNAGKSTARGCKVKLLNVRYDHGEKDLERFDPVVLRWVSPPLGPEQFKPVDILRGEKELCNVLSFVQVRQPIGNIECDGEPRGAVTRLDFNQHSDYWLEIAVFGENFKPVYTTLEVEGTGLWRLDTFFPNLEVRKRA